jgi:hypothetical protein
MKARENPFRSERIEGLAFRPRGFTLDGLVERLETLGRRGAIVGPEGSGKTTLLEALASHLQTKGIEVRLLRLRSEGWKSGRDTLLGNGANRALLVDGMESAPRPARALLDEFQSRAGWLVAALHRPGPLPTLVELRPSQDLLVDLGRDLLGEEDLRALEPELPDLFAKHRGNLRECFRELYDRYAE